jgi:phenylpyruvate tautomerase PptA (4-oxalocrotonate tautomerase family)
MQEVVMPFVRIDIQGGKSTAYKRDILHAVRAAIVGSLGVPDDRVVQRLIETPAENIDAPEARSDRLTIIEVSMLPGRDAALKQAMYAAIVAQLGEKPGIHQGDITVLVSDPSAECFAIGGVMQCVLPGAAQAAADDDEIPAAADLVDEELIAEAPAQEFETEETDE